MSAYFGDIENLWTYELELHRGYLRDSLGITTLSQLDQVYAANSNIVGKIRFFKATDRNKKLLEQKHPERIKCLVLTDFEEYERLETRNYTPSFDYLIKRMKKDALAYVDSMKIGRNNDSFMPILNTLMSELLNIDNKDIVMTFEDTPLSDGMAQMTAKHQAMRDNQSNDLENEARRTFNPPLGKQLVKTNLDIRKEPEQEQAPALFD